jgi:hypothetical protein
MPCSMASATSSFELLTWAFHALVYGVFFDALAVGNLFVGQPVAEVSDYLQLFAHQLRVGKIEMFNFHKPVVLVLEKENAEC